MEQKIKKKEILALCIIFIVLIVGFLFYKNREVESGEQVRVTVDGETYGVYDLNVSQTIPIEIDGVVTNTLVISDGVADMLSADCPDQICVDTKAISAMGETIVCLPHKVVVEVIASEEESLFDATT